MIEFEHVPDYFDYFLVFGDDRELIGTLESGVRGWVSKVEQESAELTASDHRQIADRLDELNNSV